MQDRLRIRPEDRGHEAGVQDVPLGREREALQPVGAPGRKGFDDKDILQYPLVGKCGSPVDPGRLENGLGFGDPS